MTYEKDYTNFNNRKDLKKYSLLSFGTTLREKNENWRKVFKDDLFKQFLDDLSVGDIKNKLKEIIGASEIVKKFDDIKFKEEYNLSEEPEVLLQAAGRPGPASAG